MKKKILLSATIILCSFAFFAYSLQISERKYELLSSNVESLAATDDGIVIICKCSAAPIFPNKRCIATNSGATCAQSEAGGNIMCTVYDSNCHK